MTILSSIAIFAILFSYPFLFCLYLHRKHIEVNFSRRMIYGWYNGSILASERFNPSWDIDLIMEKKSLVEKELDIAIEKYKQVKNI